MALDNYHHPEPADRGITRITAKAFISKDDSTLFAVVELGRGGSLWLTDPGLARQGIAAFVEAYRMLRPDHAERAVADLVRDVLAVGDAVGKAGLAPPAPPRHWHDLDEVPDPGQDDDAVSPKAGAR